MFYKAKNKCQIFFGIFKQVLGVATAYHKTLGNMKIVFLVYFFIIHINEIK